MKATSVFTKFTSWLASPEVFGSITKKIPGHWHLFEYYYDQNLDLIHRNENELKAEGEAMQIALDGSEKFTLNAKLSIGVFNNIKEGSWSVHRNYITFVDPKDFRNNLEFQFAFEKENLKLLKKDKMGKIEFFGFFKNDMLKK